MRTFRFTDDQSSASDQEQTISCELHLEPVADVSEEQAADCICYNASECAGLISFIYFTDRIFRLLQSSKINLRVETIAFYVRLLKLKSKYGNYYFTFIQYCIQSRYSPNGQIGQLAALPVEMAFKIEHVAVKVVVLVSYHLLLPLI